MVMFGSTAVYNTYCKVCLKKNIKLHMNSSNAVLKNYFLAADGIELPTFSAEG